ncbi:hypothetical protein SGFS_098490 [Streptomyces graminofaciens]|uniref:Acyl-CoA dehydrogenase n=1 Tax=Streptomyces graminofaciens TaxID=68212 RepID=A0ABM7FQP0_9ACTN|nr:acyl-CoA dehydrogenase [Streptomyces graminofaciens]BBC38555.1 hypothetical protein SGFS_098490 [Streptomyces graminofaciens]
MSYTPPINEYEFFLRRVMNGAEHLADVTDGEYDIDDVVAILWPAAKLAAEVLQDTNVSGDRVAARIENGQVVTAPGMREAYAKFIGAGWSSVGAPVEAGGAPRIVSAALTELWSAANPAFAMCSGLTQGAVAAISWSGTPEQKSVYLEPMAEGRWTGTMNLTEPQAGTDLAAIRTLARPQDDQTWRVSGQKIYISWGDHDLTENIVHLVLARTPDAPAGLRGLSLFIVPKFLPDADGRPGHANGVTPIALEHKMGIKGSPTCVLQYEDATGFLLGELNQGIPAMFVMMNLSRLGAGIWALGIADRAHQAAHHYAHDRVQGRVLDEPEGTPIARHPDVARLLSSSASIITAMRGLMLQTSIHLDRAFAGDAESLELTDFLIPVVKGWLTEEAIGITSDAVQVHGGAGFIEDTGVAQYYRDVRIAAIYEGTTAIQANDFLGRKILRDRASTASRVLDMIETDVRQLAEAEDPVAVATSERMTRSLASIRDVTALLLEHAAEGRRRDAHAGGVPYLKMWGLVLGGWIHVRTLQAVLDTRDGITDQSHRRISEANAYGAHHLSRVAAHAQSASAGETGY